jgi:hypothetical protein
MTIDQLLDLVRQAHEMLDTVRGKEIDIGTWKVLCPHLTEQQLVDCALRTAHMCAAGMRRECITLDLAHDIWHAIAEDEKGTRH